MIGSDSSIIEINIEQLAPLGDGIGEYCGKPVFVPFTLPGEKILARIVSENNQAIHAELLEVQHVSASRTQPFCIHFTRCGGCELQHLQEADYIAFKRAAAVNIAQHLGQGEETVVTPLVTVPPHTRRRMEVKIAVSKGAVTLGFLAARSHRVIDVEECPVLEPAIAATFDSWRQIIGGLKIASAIKAIRMTLLDGGIEAILEVSARLKLDDRGKLQDFALAQDFLSLAEQVGEKNEVISLYRKSHPFGTFAGIPVELPPNAFLQATRYSEEKLVVEVLKACEGFERIVDLYSGCGTFSFPLAVAGHRVSAYEGDADMTNAGYNAVRKAGMEGQVRFTARDLFKKPLMPDELRLYDAAVINPPRNGALPQTRALAASGLKRIAMVSCNPATFSRDAQELVRNGYRLKRLVPVDQFLWSHHLELVGVFERVQRIAADLSVRT